ncbi:unnamed protein product [Rhodiola kirilowii]
MAFKQKLESLWQELDSIKFIECGNTRACTCCKKHLDDKLSDRVVKFLMGLNDCYSSVRTHVFAMDEVPKFSIVYGLALQEEASRAMRKAGIVEGSALFSQASSGNSNQSFKSSQSSTNYGNQSRGKENTRGTFNRGRSRLFCNHCQTPGHTKETCYKLIGYPQNNRGNQNSRNNSGNGHSANAAVTEEHSSGISDKQFTPSQLEQIMAMLKGGGLADKVESHANMAVHMAGIAHSHPDLIIGDWLIDSGATSHFVHDEKLLSNMHALEEVHRVVMPNGEVIKVKFSGDCYLENGIVLSDVLLVPMFEVNLVSVSKLAADMKYQVLFTDGKCTIQDQFGRIVLETGRPVGGLYRTQMPKNMSSTSGVYSLELQKIQHEAEVWHNRLGHAPLDVVHQLLKDRFPGVTDKYYKFSCNVCPLAKQTKQSFSLSKTTTSGIFELLHSDVCGPFQEPTNSGAKYFLTVVDDFSRAVWTFLMRQKTEVPDIIIGLFALIQNQFDKQVKTFRSDNGGEFINTKMHNFLTSKGCIQQSTCPYTPEQNGLVERKHRHILEVARALMFEAGLPKHFWGDSVLTATHIINRLPTAVLKGKSPWEILFGEKPSLSHLRTFGCSCFASTNAVARDKFDARAAECIMLGYPAGQKGYKLFCLQSQKFIVSRHVVFRESVFPFKRNSQSPATGLVTPVPALPSDDLSFNDDATTSSPTKDDIIPSIDLSFNDDVPTLSPTEDDIIPSIDQSNMPAFTYSETSSLNVPVLSAPVIPIAPSQPTRKSTRQHKPPVWTKDYICSTVRHKTSPHELMKFISYDKCSDQHTHFISQITDAKEPSSYSKACKESHWIDAMNKEILALEANHTWILTELPSDKTLVDCKWIYKVKFNSDGSIERYKARLVARGFTQVEGLDYHETFAPVAKMTTVRCLLAIAAARHWPLHQLDVNNAFLHGSLDEEVYMKLPPGFYKKEKAAGKVCRLMKSLYGLKQASRQWFAKFSEALTDFGFLNSLNDYSLFTLTRNGHFLVLLVYVDDVIITGTSESLISEVKQFIHLKFQIKDLGPLKFFLGLEVARSADGIYLNQRKYAIELLAEHNMTDCKPCKTPLELKHKLSLSTEPLLADPLPYRRLVGKLIYLTITRPDLAYPVHILSQFMQSPTEEHLRAAHRLLRFIKGAPAQGIFFPSQSDLLLRAFCDADWAACPVTRRSITGYCVLLGSCIVSWKTKKQPVVSRSSAESEYRAMAAVCCELVWLARLIKDMGVCVEASIPLHCDNKAALHIAHNPVFHERTKHVELDCHLVRSHVTSQFISPVHISTSDQPADIFTKTLPLEQLRHLCSKLGVTNFLHSAA